ncbi:hypothetical protein [Aequorivita flava]|uniref:Uncharacterized protein n=1 Tax=Aequorivita flava TaxID=3114371 RepID=A0AB35YSR6_9FLAO
MFLNQDIVGYKKGFHYWDNANSRWISYGGEWKDGANSNGDNLIYAQQASANNVDVVVYDSGRMGLGTDRPEESLEIKLPGDNDIQISSVAPPNAPNLIFYTTNGTDFANRDFLADNEPIGYITAKAYNGTGKSGDLANIQIKSDGVHTAASLPTKIEFVVTQENSTGIDAANPQMVIKNNGNVGIGINDPVLPLDVNGSAIIRDSFLVGSNAGIVGSTALVGKVTIGNVSNPNATDLLEVGGNSYLRGALKVSGNSTFVGKVKIGTTGIPTATLEIAPGTSGVGGAPLKLSSGTVTTTPETGAIEYDGTQLYFTPSNLRKTVLTAIEFSYSGLSLGNIPAHGTVEVGSVPINGVRLGDICSCSPYPNIEASLIWQCFVNADNQITFRLSNISTSQVYNNSTNWKVIIYN